MIFFSCFIFLSSNHHILIHILQSSLYAIWCEFSKTKMSRDKYSAAVNQSRIAEMWFMGAISEIKQQCYVFWHVPAIKCRPSVARVCYMFIQSWNGALEWILRAQPNTGGWVNFLLNKYFDKWNGNTLVWLASSEESR